MNNIGDEFWNALNSARGTMDVRELKELFISLIFLKYANDKFTNDNHRPIKVSKIAQWDYLNTNIQHPDFAMSLWEALKSLEKENQSIQNTFSVFDFYSKFGSQKNSAVISRFFKIISGFDFVKAKLGFSDIIEILLVYTAGYEGKLGNDITTPESVSQLLIELLNPAGGSVLDSTCGTGGFFQNIEVNYPNGKFQFYGQENNWSTLAIAKLRFAFNQKNTIHFGEAKSTLDQDQFQELHTDYVIMHPPFNLKFYSELKYSDDSRFVYGEAPKSNANLLWIQHAIFHLNDTGKAAILLSNGSLSSRGKEEEIRKNLIEQDLVESIITLPSQLMANTSIPVSIWILNKNKSNSDEILFIDGSNETKQASKTSQYGLNTDSISRISSTLLNWQAQDLSYQDLLGFCKAVNTKEITKNDFQLSPARYVGVKDLENIDLDSALQLKDILTVVPSKRLESGELYKIVTVKNLSNNPDSYVLDFDDLIEGELKPNFKVLSDNGLLISKIGPNIKPTYFEIGDEIIGYASHSIIAFKVNKDIISLEYFIPELNKDYINIQLNQFRHSSTLQSFNLKDFLNVMIEVPKTIEQQNEIAEREREMRFQAVAKDLGFENEIAKLKTAQMKDLGSKKHNIMQHLNNVKSSTDVLIKLMSINKGTLKADEIIDPRRGVTVENRFLRLRQSLDSVIYYVDNITNEIQYSPEEIINPATVLKDCKEKGTEGNLFSVDLIVESATFDLQIPLVKISTNDFEEVYNNLLENARKHGFVDKDKKYIFRITVAYIDQFVQILFENNGKPFPTGISNRYNIKGEKAGTTGGTGIGLWKVSQIADHFEAIIEVIDEPNREFPVGFKFKFNLETL